MMRVALLLFFSALFALSCKATEDQVCQTVSPTSVTVPSQGGYSSDITVITAATWPPTANCGIFAPAASALSGPVSCTNSCAAIIVGISATGGGTTPNWTFIEQVYAPANTSCLTNTFVFANNSGQTLTATQPPPPSCKPQCNLSIVTSSLANGSLNSAYSQSLVAQGGTPSYTWSISGQQTGLAVDQQSGTISGTPTESGPADVTVQVTDAMGCTATKALSLQVQGPKIELSLSSQTVDPSNPDPRNPANSVVTATAVVTDGSGSPISGYVVQFSAAPLDLSVSGHAHHNLGSVPLGSFQDTSGTSTSGCTTDNAGQCGLVYIVSEFSGQYDITAASSSDPQVSDTKGIFAQLQSFLASLGPSATFRLTGASGATSYPGCPGTQIQHPSNHFGTSYLNTAMASIGATYLQRTGFSLGINDMTLPLGGRFDICADWSLGTNPNTGGSTGHFSHRKGTSVDIDSTTLSGAQQRPVDMVRLKFLAEKVWGLKRVLEEPIHYESPF